MPGSRGKVSVKRDPWPSEEYSVSVPPISTANARDNASPSPMPPCW